jgi:type IV secretion system protein VirD4
MLLDKIKSATCSLVFGLLIALVFGYAGGLAVAARHRVVISDVVAFARHWRFGYWPIDLQIFSTLAIFGGVIVVSLMWLSLRNMKWTFQSRDISSQDAATDLLNKSATGDIRIFSGKFRGKPFHASIEDRGLVIGPPGTGKTAFLFNQILRATKDELSFAAVDLKPELHQILLTSLESAGYRVLRINPARADAEADHWNPLSDINEETDITELCNSLLPVRDSKEAPFVEAQRDWLKAAVFHVKSLPGGSLPMAFNLLSAESKAENLVEILSRSASSAAARIARRIAAGLSGSKPDPLILQGLTGCLRSLDYFGLPGVQNSLGHSDFSARDLGKGPRPVALFLQFEESKINALGPLLSFTTTALLTSLIDTAKQREPVALFLDELGNMPPIPNLPEKLNTIRSRGIPTWMYFQTVEQMDRRYGKGASSLFFAAADVQIVFRLNDNETRERISSLIGTTTKRKHSSSSGKNGGTSSTSYERVNVIEPHLLGQLRPGQIVCLYRGAAALGRATPHYVDFPEFKRK